VFSGTFPLNSGTKSSPGAPILHKPAPPVADHAEMHPHHATHFYGQITSGDATEGLPAAGMHKIVKDRL